MVVRQNNTFVFKHHDKIVLVIKNTMQVVVENTFIALFIHFKSESVENLGDFFHLKWFNTVATCPNRDGLKKIFFVIVG